MDLSFKEADIVFSGVQSQVARLQTTIRENKGIASELGVESLMAIENRQHSSFSD